MKVAVIFAFAALAGVGYFISSSSQPKLTPEQRAHLEWRRTTAEKVTAVRPERFEAMKWHPQDKGIELRAPASSKHK
jgi:hypothetical protein